MMRPCDLGTSRAAVSILVQVPVQGRPAHPEHRADLLHRVLALPLESPGELGLVLVECSGLPPCLPLAFAGSSPAIILSRMIPLSNPARAAKTWKINHRRNLMPTRELLSDAQRTRFSTGEWHAMLP